MKALKDIEMVDCERGHPILRYIQDHTVIEDTESTIGLICKGWKLYNYPASLSYSATPSDFVSLCIQGCRWANGGLIIFLKLTKYLLFGNTSLRQRLIECFVRSYYLLSIALVNLTILIMLIYPFGDGLYVELLLIATSPYLIFYARDLGYLSYTEKDLLRLFAINLLLMPINNGGCFNSIDQLLFRKKTPFHRTSKIKERTVVSSFYVLIEVFLCIYLMFDCAVDLHHRFYARAIFSGTNSLLL
jgi:cellulose synthase (UDP-forming)